jgi:predicted ATPase
VSKNRKMQKIIIKNFRAIEFAEIELKKILVLIGEQASGKSTVAKLVYFFKTIQDDFFVQVYESGNVDLEQLVRRKFIEFFGLVKRDFELEFWFGEDKHISIKHTDVYISLSNLFTSKEVLNIEKIANKLSDDKKLYEDDVVNYLERNRLIKQLRTAINNIFNANQEDNLYVIAGRNVTVSYSDIFEQYLDSKIRRNIDNGKSPDSTDEQLMLKFIERVKDIKQSFKGGGSFQGFYSRYDNLENTKNQNSTLQKIDDQSRKILKSNYRFISDVEELRLEGKEIAIALSDASSGQQEVIRILQDLFLVVLYENKFLRIIEEPEAHLFPIAQKELIELLALAVNYQPENQLIIATHSPYILSVFNNLLFANEVVAKDASLKNEVATVIEEDFWLKAEDFRAYTLGGEEAYCESIMSEDGGMIDQNYLDEVSEILGMEFYALRELYRKTFKSKRR